ncbi:MAG: hypothetical protein HN600_09130 [Bacteroidetes bacterium]|jgi:hypothetical protein|nr:hypothetical protein [Bacteroidota bacterium]
MNKLFAVIGMIVIPLIITCDESDTFNPLSDEQLRDMKFYLVEEYDPGICFGMPSPISDVDIENLYNLYQDLIPHVETRFMTTDSLDVFFYVNKYKNVSLSEHSGSEYLYTLLDGGCCIITTYTGVIYLDDLDIIFEESNSDIEGVPC